jgi:hypothetical protein
MGWFGCGPMDGDDGMDLRAELWHFIGVKQDDETYEVLSSDDEIKELLESKQNLVYDWLRDYDWGTYNPGFKQEVYIQAVAYLMCRYGARINDRGYPVFLDFIKKDQWAKQNKERKIEMKKLKKNVKKNRLPKAERKTTN